MFALWYFSLAVDEVRKRFGFVNRIFLFFNGNGPASSPPAIEAQKPESPKTAGPTVAQSKTSSAPAVPKVEIPVPTEVVLPKPVAVPVPKPAEPKPSFKPEGKSPVKPAPPVAVPVAKPTVPVVEPVKPKVETIPPPSAKPEPAKPVEQPKIGVVPSVPSPAITPVVPTRPAPAINGQAQSKAVESAKPAPMPKSPDAATTGSSLVVELPTSNEDSFIIVEKQKPKVAVTDVKDATLGFLKAEGAGFVARR
ncbi:uncharacterized protein LOC128738080 [Sabethes cyaneus]|uniref:uncharacterized protein LOC128738080 n=1 Tax=Sabethes cyaneus TaxID=53552 RepID=UPI00237DBDC8|nr:uncharacterized protein LOC128738080 [Sabethes cyaneus]